MGQLNAERAERMKFWNVIDWVIMGGIAALLGLILFVPLPIFANYGFFLFVSVLIIGVLSLIHLAYVFIKETPERKWGKPKPEAPQVTFLNLKIKTWKKIGEWTFLLAVFFVLWQFQKGSIGSKECPDIIRGNIYGTVAMQYFYSPFCPACWEGERVLQELIAKYPNVRFENYDLRYCKEAAFKAKVSGSPAYHVQNLNASEVVYGLDSEKIESVLCKLGGC